MPKNRGNNSIARRADADEAQLDEMEMSERIRARLLSIGTITVNMPSRTRGRTEGIRILFDEDNLAEVETEGGSYTVNPEEGSCTCPDHRFRRGRCRHIEAVDIARDRIRQGIMQGSENDSEVTSPQFTTETLRNEQDGELSISREYVDDNQFYTEDRSLFDEDFAAAANAPIPYEYNNALNGSDLTFGIELEFVDGDSDAIAAELYELGICGNSSMNSYHAVRIPGKWTLERDGSVTMGNRGGELISPILKDTPETWRQIEKVCEVAERHGARVDTRTGGHVHIGATDSLDGKRQRWRRFFKMCAGFEQVYTRLSGGEQGIFRGGHYAQSSMRQSLRGIRASLPQEGSTREFAHRIAEISNGKYQRMNIGTFATKGTVEFRGFNGTLTPGIIQANVKYAAGVVHSAERSRIKGSETDNITPTGSDRKRGRIINNYMENNMQNNDSIMAALDAVFSRRSDKQHILSVIAKNRWE